jgi:Zn-dependent protease with chaperone function
MFANFIYFILAILIFSTYPLPEEPHFSFSETLLWFVCVSAVFGVYTRIQFARLIRRARAVGFQVADNMHQRLQLRHSILALGTLTFVVFGIDLPYFVLQIPLIAAVPTIGAAIFVILFIGYLALIWDAEHPLQRTLYNSDIPRRTYILSNISFAVPVLLPWLTLSGLMDLIRFLPFGWAQTLVNTPEGQMAYLLVFLFVVAIVGPSMIQKFWRCKPLEEGVLRERIAAVCRRANMQYADILYWPIFGGRMITAGVMGLVKQFRYILVTRAMLSYLEPEEIDAVIAHEVGHIKKKHLLFYLLFFVGFIFFFSYLAEGLRVYILIYLEPLISFLSRLETGTAATIFGLLSLAIVLTFFLIYFRFVFGYFMRNFERQADTYVYSLFKNSQPLITTLKKIAVTSGQPADRPNWHHFSIKERVDFLTQCEQDARWIERHDQKVRKSVLAYFAGIALIAILGYQLNMGEIGKRLDVHFSEKYLLRLVEKTPRNAEALGQLGDLYHHKQKFAQAIEAYERSLTINAENPRVLNNLAWLYATSEDQSYIDPTRALELARQAAQRDPAPHILDTLAEAYYVNGMFHEAIVAETRALERVKTNRQYYEKQLKKFKNALEGSS